MTITLYRPSLRLTSGAGQLIRMQAEGLRAAGAQVQVACRTGALKFRWRTKLPTRRITLDAMRALASSARQLLVDHGAIVPEARVVFVHNVMAEAARYVPGAEWESSAGEERAFYSALRDDAVLVANSEAARRALVEHFGLRKIVVEYPGFDASRFAGIGESARRVARSRLGVRSDEPLVGFVTSGHFQKRGLDVFLDAATRIAKARPDARFLVVGSRRLPEWARRHALVERGVLRHRPKSQRPEPWFAALDVFLYPAHYEEFGIVVSEAQALGLPVLTSRRVGAAECLPAAYADGWLLERPDAAGFAERALALLEDGDARRRLGEAGRAAIGRFDRARYVAATVRLILAAQKELP